MFFQNVGYRWSLPLEEQSAGKGILFLPTGNDRLRFADSLPDSQILFDPQLYLAGLDRAASLNVCSRLATYPWFATPGIPDFDPEAGKKAWQEQVREATRLGWRGAAPSGAGIAAACSEAIRFQQAIGCAFIILPAPLIVNREDEAQQQADWLDSAVTMARDLDVARPIIATVALSEGVLNEAAFARNGFLETVIDQISSRDGIDGVYIVIAQTHAEHPFETNALVHRAYLTLAKGFRRSGLEVVITNFADVFGLACMGVGASGFATGASQSLRRLSLDGFDDDGGGLPLPHLYSHKVVGEFLSQADLSKIRDKKLLRRVSDLTPHSKDLLDALGQGRSASDIVAWVESKNNLAAAQRHFLSRMTNESESLDRMAPGGRFAATREWLEDADVNGTYLISKLGEDLRGRIAPTAGWLEIFDGV